MKLAYILGKTSNASHII